jgi:phosphatidylserine decarboxylase
LITEYGYDVFFTVTFLCIILAFCSFLFIEHTLVKWGIVLISASLFLFTLNFFRDPERTIPQGSDIVLSPADGKIIAVTKVTEENYIGGEAMMISIFMSPLNVHVNRYPINGTVEYYRYVPGEYFAAFEDKASLKNEQTHIGIIAPKGKVLFKQIAGFIARRIVCNTRPGDTVEAGRRFGMIKFGSRVDVYVPSNSSIKVAMGETTVAGETILAQLNQKTIIQKQ